MRNPNHNYALIFCVCATLTQALPAVAGVDAEVRKGTIEKNVVVPKTYDAGVEHNDHAQEVLGKFDKLLDVAIAKDPHVEELKKAVAHYRTAVQRAKVRLQDGLNVLIPYKGYAQSSEAGDLITGEKSKLNGRSAAELQMQTLIDEKHVQLTQLSLQVVAGLGESNKERGQVLVAKGRAKLTDLVGQQEADEMIGALGQWQAEVTVPESIMMQDIAAPEEQAARHELALKRAVEADVPIKNVLDDVHKYNHQSLFRRASGRVIGTALGVASMAPCIVGTASTVGISVYEVASGGSEEHKLLKEMYMGKRLESRKKTLSEELHLALTNYDLGLAKRNPLMVAYTEMLVSDMCGAKTAREVFGQLSQSVEDEQKVAETTSSEQAAAESDPLQTAGNDQSR